MVRLGIGFWEFAVVVFCIINAVCNCNPSGVTCSIMIGAIVCASGVQD